MPFVVHAGAGLGGLVAAPSPAKGLLHGGSQVDAFEQRGGMHGRRHRQPLQLAVEGGFPGDEHGVRQGGPLRGDAEP